MHRGFSWHLRAWIGHLADGLAELGDFSGRRRTAGDVREDVHDPAGRDPRALSSSGARTGEGTEHDLESSNPEEGGVVAQVGRLGVAALAGLVVADVILVSLAVGHVRGASGAGAEPPSDQGGQVTAGGPKKEKKPEKKPQPAVVDPAASRMLVDIGEGDAVGRAISGTCGEGGAKVQLSLDGGKSFNVSSVPSAEVVLRLAVTDADNTTLVAADADCEEVATWYTENGGGSWEYVPGPTDVWHKLAKPAAAVHAPDGDEPEVPCDGSAVVTVSTLGTDVAYVLCADGLVASTFDGGESWTEQGTVEGAAGLDFITAETGLAVVAGHESCEGIAVLRSTDTGQSWEPHGCIETDAISELADISTTGDRAYVSAGEAIWYSEDGGATWEQRSG